MSSETASQREASAIPDLRVAIVGAGPAGFYAALDLLDQESPRACVDMFDRLPAPFGLVRYGVAPDHGKIRKVTAFFSRRVEAAGDRFRFFGNVELGEDISIDELREHYDAVVLSFGAQTDRVLGIPGEDLPQVYAAREFVAWYNGHPDFATTQFELTAEKGIVVGVGNVAVDVARMLMRTREEMAVTDVSDLALEVLAGGRIQEVAVVARRGPLQAKTTPSELLELTKMANVDLVVSASDLELDPVSQAVLDRGDVTRQTRRNLEIMEHEALRAPRPGRRCVRLRFYLSPIEVTGPSRVTAVRFQRNLLEEKKNGYLGVVPTGATEVMGCGVIFRSIGYKVAPVPGVPFNPDRSVIPHEAGQVLSCEEGQPARGLFVAGWAKRGPSGVIGTNKPDAIETVASLLAAHGRGELSEPATGDIVALLEGRRTRYVTYEDWKRLDAIEVEAGRSEGRPRSRLTSVEAMLAAVGKGACEAVH